MVADSPSWILVNMSNGSEKKEVDVVETEVMMLLPELEADELEKVCTLIPLTCPEPAKGKKNTLLKLLFKHLLSLEEDGGFATYQVIHKYLVR